ncbi:MAG: phosphate acyltransferase PlsX [Bryobacterales bacterium]|nr:phosphate acyltransferase PlsX [Bryobacterales bacterium]
MKRIAVDAMGGDHAPDSEVKGAVQAARELGHEVILVGQESVVQEHLRAIPGAGSLPIRIVHASEVITMHDSAAKAVRTKKDSSIRVACRLVRDGEADGVVSAGNTGAVMATAKMVLRPIPGVERPALASVFPTAKGPDHPAVMADVGANVDCTPNMLAQFALMGEIYVRAIFGYASPRVGILSIGEEEHKGNELTKATTPLLKELPINFIGNVEGRDLYSGEVEVVVCDGFIGNVALKVSEGLVETIRHILRGSLEATITGKIGYALARPAFADFKKRLDYSEYGGAPLLGVQGCTIVCHGRSNPNAIKNAIRVAAEFAEARVTHQIEREMARLRDLTANPYTEFV